MKRKPKKSLYTRRPQANSNSVKAGGESAPSQQAGFSLIEVTTAAFVMVVVFLGAFAGMTQTYSTLERIRNQSRANQIIQSEMEDLRLKNWGQLQQILGQHTAQAETEFSDEYGNRYSCVREVLPHQRDPETCEWEQLRLVVTISWSDQRHQSHRRNVETLFTKEGINDYFTRVVAP